MKELGHDLTPFEEVRDRVLALVEPLGCEEVELGDGWGRVLGEDLVAREPVPPFDNSAMDGYAVRAEDLDAASDDRPVTLPVAAVLGAGEGAGLRLEPGRAMRIMTGAPLPGGAEAVVPHEQTRFTEREVTFFRSVAPGKNIRRAGGDMKPGDRVLASGTRLRGPQLAVAATVGRARFAVTRQPRVAILSPGNELVEPWESPQPGQIRSSNAYGLAGFVREEGGVPDRRGIVPDDPDTLRVEIRAAIASGADLLLTTGGVSAGDFDFVQAVVRQDGQPGFVFKTDMRPGKPQVFGVLDGVPLLGLPGNPAAAIVSFTVFVRPVLRRMLGAEPVVPQPFFVRFAADFQYKKGRVFMLRARVEPDPEGGFLFAGAGDQDSSFLSSLASANAIIQLPADRDHVRAGDVFPARWIHGCQR